MIVKDIDFTVFIESDEIPYYLVGNIIPQRAILSVNDFFNFETMEKIKGKANLRIVQGQILLIFYFDKEASVQDLKNMCSNMIRNYLALVSHLSGNYYSFELTRITNTSKNIDWVYGVDAYWTSPRMLSQIYEANFKKLKVATTGAKGRYISRALTDLKLALEHPTETAFYCYRAIESLFQNYAQIQDLDLSKKPQHWANFRQNTKCTREDLMLIKNAADPIRHGRDHEIDELESTKIVHLTWRIVDVYLKLDMTPSEDSR